MVIKWTNKYSGESGYVASVSRKERHFVNTPNYEEARVYSANSVSRIIKDLTEFGEAEDNYFEVIE